MKNNVIRGITTLLTIILTASLGRIQYGNHTETWYDLPMQKVVSRAAEQGLVGDYWERADGMKMFGKYIILASHESIPIGTVVEVSRGTGIVLDRHEMADKYLYDIATTWKE